MENVDQTTAPLRIAVVGTRGIPGIQGGIETHCEELYTRLAAMGHDVTVMRRKPYVTDENRMDRYKGVKLIDISVPKKKSLEAIVHTFLAVIRARRLKPDIIHFHAIGPSIFVPLARMLGMKVVMTNHGPDYNRQKWGRFAKFILRRGEAFSARYSNAVIVIAPFIADIIAEKYGRKDVTLIHNGVNIPRKATSRDYLRSIGIADSERYIVALGRFVREKGFHDLIEAYTKASPEGVRLVIAGDSDHPDAYSESLKEEARRAGVIMPGYIRGEKLNELMSHASLFVMPSYHEGLPISLLEAMSYSLDVIVSDIPATRLPQLTDDDRIVPGDTDALAALITDKLSRGLTPRSYDLTPYNWDNIARQVEQTYRKLTD